MQIDWNRWDTLTEELRETEGPYASFAAWEQLMAEACTDSPYGDSWWDHLELFERAELFDMMARLRGWAAGTSAEQDTSPGDDEENPF